MRKYKAGLMLDVLEYIPVAIHGFYHNPIANIAVMSMYRQSGGENAGFWTEVSIKHRVRAKSATLTLIGRYSETTQALQI